MAEARSEEEEENMMRDSREQVVRRQQNRGEETPGHAPSIESLYLTNVLAAYTHFFWLMMIFL